MAVTIVSRPVPMTRFLSPMDKTYPDLKEFKKLAKKGNIIPLTREILADLETPVSAFKKLEKDSDCYLLESVEGEEKFARYSFIGLDPFLIFKSKGKFIEIEEKGKIKKVTGDPLETLENLMKKFKVVEIPGLPRFFGGGVGYLAYDLVRFFEKLPEKNSDDLKLPDVYLIFSAMLVVFDHLKHKIKIIFNVYIDGQNLVKSYQRALRKIDKIIAKLKSPLNFSSESSFSKKRKVSFASNLSKSSFVRKVKKAKEYIKAGDVIQVVISQRFQTEIKTEPFNLYRALRSINPSPYMYYLKFKDLKLVGSSPEILVRLEGNKVTIRPIAGTRPRGKDEREDRFLEKELLSDEKEKAEHIMLVDLGRNDAGRVCRYGSVKVNELMRVEQYSHVMHLVSDISGRLAKGKDQFDVLKSSFPAGTVTGAPKVRAMEIIEELEPIRRGPYAGAVGYFSFLGNLDACITIRTLVIKDNVAYLQAGAGIVADSVPEREYTETKNKARALMEAIKLAEEGLI